MLCLEPIGKDCVISDLRYKGTILQRNYRKMTIFMVIFLELLRKTPWLAKIFGRNMTVLFPNPCYNEVYYKETVMYIVIS